jgi:hypothetical protein
LIVTDPDKILFNSNVHASLLGQLFSPAMHGY